MANEPIIRVKDLVGGYGEEIILDHVSFEVYSGEIFIILGGSGCGKSTLLKHLIGLIKPISGRIIIDREDLTACDEHQFHKILNKIGILYQSGALIGSMTIGENVGLPIQEYTDLPPRAIHHLINIKLNLVHLDGYENHLPSEISGGMKKRAGLARALALNPKILFFDEPSAGLDPVTSAGIDHLILHLNKHLGTTMVIVTHELASVFTLADRVIMLDKRAKGIIADGDPTHLKEQSRNAFVRQFFNRQAVNMPLKERAS